MLLGKGARTHKQCKRRKHDEKEQAETQDKRTQTHKKKRLGDETCPVSFLYFYNLKLYHLYSGISLGSFGMLAHHQQILIAGTPLGCISEVPQGSTPTGFKKPTAQQSRIPGIPGFQNSGNHQRVPIKKKNGPGILGSGDCDLFFFKKKNERS